MARKPQSQATARRTLDHNRQVVTPVNVPRSYRGHEVSCLTSLPAGRMVPISAAPLLREDAVRRGNISLSFEMHETAEILMNAVHCQVSAYFVPYLAFDRVDGMDALNKAYMGQAGAGDFFEIEPRGAVGTNAILEYLGLHARPTDQINTAYVEAYNQIWNFRAKNRSVSLTERTRLDKTLAPAFWKHTRYRHIVPDFDQAMIDGAVALQLQQQNQVLAPLQELPLRGLAKANGNFVGGPRNAFDKTGAVNYAGSSEVGQAAHGGDGVFYVEQGTGPAAALPNLRVVLPEISIPGGSQELTVLLSDIDAARKSVWFAKLREQYNGLDDEYIIDMLMQGISVPEQMYKQPMLLAQKETIFGFSKRYASDGANLTESVVNGATVVDLNIRIPRMTTGGIVMIVAECVPDQLFERQQDPLLHLSTVAELPDAMRDELDPEKVDVVYNRYVDTDHDTPDSVFGYEPLNAKWDVKVRRVGGRFLRPEVDAPFDEDRQRIWSSEVQNPTLSSDFYLASDVHIKPFADQTQDPFEVVASGQLVIEGNTVFGPALIEASDNYAKVVETVPQQRIQKPPATP